MRFAASWGLIVTVAFLGAAGAADDAEVRPAVRIGERDGVPLYRKELISPVLTVDRIYKSMRGPASVSYFTIDGGSEPELLWVVAYRASMTGSDGESPLSPEFMCHSNVNVTGTAYRERFQTHLRVTGDRLLALDQGVLAQEFPEGFGVPVMSNHRLLFNAQVLNHNIEDRTLHVRQKVQIDYLRDADLEKPLVPLVQHGVFGMVLIDGEDGHFGVDPVEVDEATHGPGCSLGSPADSQRIQRDDHGRRFSGFWMVEPGRHVYHTRVTPMLELPYDTTAHFISAHLHPFGESLELRDLTTGETVFKADARQTRDKIGLERVETFSSVVGVPLYKNHEYDLISIYNNTSGEPQDAMATMLIYLRAQDLYPFDFRRSGRSGG